MFHRELNKVGVQDKWIEQKSPTTHNEEEMPHKMVPPEKTTSHAGREDMADKREEQPRESTEEQNS
eukprot:4928132-Prorocentrum_lima.AAC.1